MLPKLQDVLAEFELSYRPVYLQKLLCGVLEEVSDSRSVLERRLVLHVGAAQLVHERDVVSLLTEHRNLDAALLDLKAHLISHRPLSFNK